MSSFMSNSSTGVGAPVNSMTSDARKVTTTPYYQRQPSTDDSVVSDENNRSTIPPNLVSEQSRGVDGDVGGFGIRQRKNFSPSSSRSSFGIAKTTVEYNHVNKLNHQRAGGDVVGSEEHDSIFPKPPRGNRFLSSSSSMLHSRSSTFMNNVAANATTTTNEVNVSGRSDDRMNNTNTRNAPSSSFAYNRTYENDIATAWSKWVIVFCDSNPYVKNWIVKQMEQIGPIRRRVGIPSLSSSLSKQQSQSDKAKNRNWIALEYDTEYYSKKAQTSNTRVLMLPSTFSPYLSSTSAASSSLLFGSGSTSNSNNNNEASNITIGITILPLTKVFASRLGLAYEEKIDQSPCELLLSLPMDLDEIVDHSMDNGTATEAEADVLMSSPNNSNEEEGRRNASTTKMSTLRMTDIYCNPIPNDSFATRLHQDEQHENRLSHRTKQGIAETFVRWWFMM